MHLTSSLAFTIQAAVRKSHLHLAHLSISAWVHGDDTGELPHATSCVVILHKENIVDGQVPARSRPLLALLQAEEELLPPTLKTRIRWPSVVHVSNACMRICRLARRLQGVLAVPWTSWELESNFPLLGTYRLSNSPTPGHLQNITFLPRSNWFFFH